MAAAVGEIERFALDVYRVKARSTESFAFSPASLGLGLALVAEGARGTTASQMAAVTHASERGVRGAAGDLSARLRAPGWPVGAELRLFRRLFADPTVQVDATFDQLARTRYLTPVDRLDFVRTPSGELRDRVDAQVSAATSGRIAHIMPAEGVDGRKRLSLIDGVSLVARPASPMGATLSSFHTASGPVPHPFVTMGVTEMPYGETVDAQIVEVPIGGAGLRVTLVVPKAKEGLSKLEARLDRGTLLSWRDALNTSATWISFPRITIETLVDVSTLSGVGLLEVFSSSADLSGLGHLPPGGDRLTLGEVRHLTRVEIADEGEVRRPAPAGPVAPHGPTRGERIFNEVRADRPFLFFVEDRLTGAMIAMGRVARPASM